MPTKLDQIIFGESKSIDFAKFNLGAVVKAVAFDLQEFDTKGVQGLAVKGDDAKRVITYCEAAKLGQPYIQAGVVKNDLVLVVRDKKNDKFEQMAVLVKNYKPIREKLAKNNAAVVNLDPGDPVIDGAVDALKDLYKTQVQTEKTADFGKITGNIVLSAHGTPDNLKSGKVIGTELAGKSPEQIVQLLIDKGMGPAYDGRVDLSGCFTASGGPAASKKDATFAEKVLKVLRKKGYAKVTVEAWPGPMYTNKHETYTDSVGTTQKRGQEGVWANQQDKAGSAVQKKVNELNADVARIAKDFKAIADSIPQTRPASAGPARDDWDQKNEQLKKLKASYEDAIKELGKLNKSDAMKTFANYKGTFGLRKI
jgi:hypothetical protein